MHVQDDVKDELTLPESNRKLFYQLRTREKTMPCTREKTMPSL